HDQDPLQTFAPDFLPPNPMKSVCPYRRCSTYAPLSARVHPHPSSTHLANGRYADFTSPLRIIQVFQRAAQMSQHHRPPKTTVRLKTLLPDGQSMPQT